MAKKPTKPPFTQVELEKIIKEVNLLNDREELQKKLKGTKTRIKELTLKRKEVIATAKQISKTYTAEIALERERVKLLTAKLKAIPIPKKTKAAKQSTKSSKKSKITFNDLSFLANSSDLTIIQADNEFIWNHVWGGKISRRTYTIKKQSLDGTAVYLQSSIPPGEKRIYPPPVELYAFTQVIRDRFPKTRFYVQIRNNKPINLKTFEKDYPEIIEELTTK